MNKKVYLMFLALAILALAPILNAQGSLGTAKQDECIDIIQTCSSCTYNNISSIKYPNGTLNTFSPEISMNQSGTQFSYQICSNFTSQIGQYDVNGHGDLDGSDEVWRTHYTITGSGDLIDSGNSTFLLIAILFFLILGTLAFVGYTKSEQKPIVWTFLLMCIIFFVAGLNLLSSLIPDAIVNSQVVTFFDNFAAISFYGLWFAFGMIILIWVLTFINTMFYKKNKRKFEKFGDQS